MNLSQLKDRIIVNINTVSYTHLDVYKRQVFAVPLLTSTWAKLLNYGFNNYKGVNVIQKGKSFAQVEVNKGTANTIDAVAKENVSVRCV